MDFPTIENPPLASIDAIKAYLVGLVTAGANAPGSTVQLTYLGGEFAKAAGQTFEQHITVLVAEGLVSMPISKRKMAPFLQAYCKDMVRVERLPSGAFVVQPIGGEGEAQSGEPVQVRANLKFKRPVWAAFIRPLNQGKRYLNLDQIGFTDADLAPDTGAWKEIEGSYILGAAPGAPIDGAELQARIEAWALASDVPISKLIISPSTAAVQGRPLQSLLDLIDSLPSHVAADWSIPALILKHLRHAR